MTAGGTIEWERSGISPTPNTPHTNQQGGMSEPSPEPTPDSEAPDEAAYGFLEHPNKTNNLGWQFQNSGPSSTYGHRDNWMESEDLFTE